MPSGGLDADHTPDAIRVRLGAAHPPSLLRDAVLGAIDGCVTTFAVVAGAVGGSLSEQVILILGLSNLLADGFSMAASNYLGAKSQDEELQKAEAEELKHIETVPEGEREEIRQIFAAKGFKGELLERITGVITSDRKLWVRTMLTEELGLRSGQARPVRAGAATFVAFCVAGMVPLSVYLVPGMDPDTRFSSSMAATAATFLGVGLLKGRLVGRPAWTSGLQTLLLGGAAAGLAYLAGHVLSRILGM